MFHLCLRQMPKTFARRQKPEPVRNPGRPGAHGSRLCVAQHDGLTSDPSTDLQRVHPRAAVPSESIFAKPSETQDLQVSARWPEVLYFSTWSRAVR